MRLTTRFQRTFPLFLQKLNKAGVLAYICGHTHNYSVVKIEGVWQIESGHARGQGDLGAPSTFLIIHVNGDTVEFNTYRDVHNEVYDYIDIIHRGTLKSKVKAMD